MNTQLTRNRRLASHPATWVIAALIGITAGCGDDVITDGELGADVNAVDDAGEDAGADADTNVDAGCTGAIGCVCTANDECDSKLCHIENGSGLCGKPCETGGKAGCDDGDPCTLDTCKVSVDKDKDSTCNHPAATKGTACDDGSACTKDDGCDAGKCAGATIDCNDNNACTTDGCDTTSGCTNKGDVTSSCDDGDACTKDDACKAGTCTGGGKVSCDDGNPCTTDSCAKATGCKHATKNGGACDDGSACTTGDTCAKGVCTGGKALICDDKNPCTKDSCDATKGCEAASIDGKPCNDGSACTLGDACAASKCAPGKKANCDDGNPCTKDACDMAVGCTATALIGDKCDDGSACTIGDKCAVEKDGSSVCAPGAAKICDDNNPCTKDACDLAVGCTTTNLEGANCVPAGGNKCNTGGACKAGVCAVVQRVGCDDGNGCTVDACDKNTGLCTYKSVKDGSTCTDGNACTGSDACKAGSCKSAPKVCDDKNACTADNCDPATGCTTKALVNTPCTDGSVCTQKDTCKGGKCTGGAKIVCDDGNPCTDDLCVAKTGCRTSVRKGACSDGNACTSKDTCKNGWCQPGPLADCNDGNSCTVDSCDAKSGCVKTPAAISCNDGNPCSVADLCSDGACKAGKLQSCDDNNACTADKCDTKKGCVSLPVGVSCTDGDACTIGDACKDGTCVKGAFKTCDDNNTCTADSCDPKSGCTYVNSLANCTDGDACTVGDGCKQGKCVPGAPQKCDDGNACSDDACDKTKGCVQKANANKCDDNNACTVGDACKAGFCQGGTKPLACDDKNPCTDDFCRPDKGCVKLLSTKLCDDGDACTVDDACKAGKCQPGAKRDCNDNNSCTDDSCDQKVGCKNVINKANPFNAINDTGAKDSGDWTFEESKSGKVTPTILFGHSGAGYYRMAAGATKTWYFMKRSKAIDLNCTGAPTLYVEQRFAAAVKYIEVSLDQKKWTALQSVSHTDHVWRRYSFDLSKYKNKLLWLRMRYYPNNSTYFWNLRKIEVKDKEALPKKVSWGTKLACASFKYEGPAFRCDTTETPFRLSYHGVVALPDTNGYNNVAQTRWLYDTKGVKAPAVTFQERTRGMLALDVREPAGKWVQVWSRGNSTDYVWRTRTLYLDKYKGKTLQLRFRATMGPTNWVHVRKLATVDQTKPAEPPMVKAPVKLSDCKLWRSDGSRWTCDPSQTIFKLAYTGDAAQTFNTNSYYHYQYYERRIDLSALTKPQFVMEQRYHAGQLYVQVSNNGTSWSHIYSHGNGVDYVWRTIRYDLTSWKNKKKPIYLRIYVRPNSKTYWGHHRNIRIEEAPKDPATLPWAGKIDSCGMWKWEGPSWKCDPAQGSWLFRVDTVNSEPNPGNYWQYNTLDRWITVPKTGTPSIFFEYRRNWSYLNLQISTNGTSWSNRWQMSGGSPDYVWRQMRYDLKSYKGKKIRIRLGTYPGLGQKWAEIRKLSLQQLPVWKDVKFGTKPECKDFEFEGTVWTCGTGAAPYFLRFQASKAQPSPNNNHHLARWKVNIDLTGTKKPTLYFEARRFGGDVRIYATGPSIGTRHFYSLGGVGKFWRRRNADLTQFAGKKISLYFYVRPQNENYWADFRNLVFKEREAEKTIMYTTPLKTADWWLEGGWKWDSLDSRHKLDSSFPSEWQYLTSQVKIDLKGLKDPVLSVRMAGVGITRYVRASTDGKSWQTVRYFGNPSQAIERREELSLKNWKDKSIYLRFDGYPNGANRWWNVGDIVFKEATVINTVPASTVLSKLQFEPEGLWKHESIFDSWAMNKGVKGASYEKLLYGYYHSLTATVAWDVSKLTKPALIYRERSSGSHGHRQLRFRIDGGSWQHLGYSSSLSSTKFWQDHVFDLSKWKPKKTVQVRFYGYAHTDYWWQVNNIHMGDVPAVPVVSIGYKPVGSDWHYHGHWTDKTTHLDATMDNEGQQSRLTLKKGYNFKGISKPQLVFEEAFKTAYRYVYCSYDGKSWRQAFYTYNGQQGVFKQRIVNLQTCGNRDKVQIRFATTRRHGSGEFWRLRNITVTK